MISSSTGKHIALGICTYKRPVFLKKALESLIRLSISPEKKVSYIIVDNDKEASAFSVVKTVLGSSHYPYIYKVASQKGIPFARNVAIEQALEIKADYLAFIDDDEEAQEEWLYELLKAMETHEASIACGPKMPVFESKDVPLWMVEGDFFEKSRYTKGQILSCADTGNIIFDMRIFKDNIAYRFDEAMANTGGTDTKLTRQLSKNGYKIVWASQAIVFDFIPASRMCLKWLLQRHFRNGLVSYKINKDIYGPKSLLRLVMLLGFHFLKGCSLLFKTLSSGRKSFYKGLLHFAESVGLMAGLFHFKYNEYDRVHGR